MTLKRMKVSVVSGFLGAGKTTLINALLRAPAMDGTLVIVNEFGDVGIDAALIETALDDTILLSSGCICCSIRGDLRDTLITLLTRRAAGTMAPFDRVIIETSGVTDPGPVLQLLAEDQEVSKFFQPAGMVTVVDATSVAGQVAGFEEAERQIALADLVMISKADLTVEDDAAAALNLVRSINPLALVVGPEHLMRQPELLWQIDPRLPCPTRLQAESHRFAFQSVTLETPVDWPRFSAFIASLLSLRGSAILRVKGVVNVIGYDEPVVLHCVHDKVYPPIRLSQWPHGKPLTQLVFITSGPAFPPLQKALETALASERTG